jgi:hypothetical protein
MKNEISRCPALYFLAGSLLTLILVSALAPMYAAASPEYSWHTFHGSANDDVGSGIAVDGSGNIYVTGKSNTSWNGPGSCLTSGISPCPLNAFTGGYDVFLLKLDSSGAYQWHTFYGSTGDDAGNGIAVDGSGNVYVIGVSSADWGISENRINGHSGGDDIFVIKLNSNGERLWHTFLGSVNDDGGVAIAVDSGGNTYITGSSTATWGTSPVHAFTGYVDAVVAKLNSSGVLQWNSFYGSGSSDGGNGIALDGSGNIYVVGSSWATWSVSAASPVNGFSGSEDIFALKLNNSGAYQWHTFLGAGNNFGSAIALDASNNVYITGYSDTTWGLPVNSHSGGIDLVAAKLNNSGVLQWNTFYGSPTADTGNGIAVDDSGNVYIAGFVADSNISAFKFNSSGKLQWFAASGYGSGAVIDIDSSGNVYVAGTSNATTGSPIHQYSGGNDIFIVKLLPDSCSSTPARIEGGSAYTSVHSAYTASGTGNSILVQAMELSENLNLNRDISFKLLGGYDCDFSANPTGRTIIRSMTVSNGAVTVDQIMIR